MKEVDYLIVGGGFAGMFFAHHLIKNGKSFKLFSGGKLSASEVSAGICNPVVLKRFNLIWKHEDVVACAKKSLKEIGEYLHEDFFIDEPVVRIFHDEEERNTWLKKAEESRFQPYLSTDILQLKRLENPYGAGLVKGTGRINSELFFDRFKAYLKEQDCLREEYFIYQKIDPEQHTYENLKYDKIIFAEGTGVQMNPYFKEVPVVPNKGHRAIVSFDKDLDPYIIKGKYFLFQVAPQRYFYGATYDPHGYGDNLDEQAIDLLRAGLDTMLSKEASIETVVKGFRATTPDRRGIVGKHPQIADLYILNGLGARGVFNGSFLGNMLYQSIEHGGEILPEVNVARFKKD